MDVGPTRQTEGVRTLLALIVAAAMIAGALVIRQGRNESGGALLGSDDGEAPTLVCITELADVCEALAEEGVDVAVEEAGITADRLAGGEEVAHDGWLTFAPWRDLTSEARERSGSSGFPAGGSTVARSPLVLVGATERVGVLEQQCKGGLSWRCLGVHAGTPWEDLGGEAGWGRVKPGYADPSTNATGLLVLGAAASDFFGRSDFNARDLEGDKFLAWLTQLEDGAGDHGSAANTPLAQQLQFGAGRFDVVGTTEAEAGPKLERSAQRAGDFAIQPSKTVVVADVVLAQLRPGDAAERLRESVEESAGAALAGAGWRVQGEQAVAGVGDTALPAESGLPSAGVLDALRVRWGEVAR